MLSTFICLIFNQAHPKLLSHQLMLSQATNAESSNQLIDDSHEIIVNSTCVQKFYRSSNELMKLHVYPKTYICKL